VSPLLAAALLGAQVPAAAPHGDDTYALEVVGTCVASADLRARIDHILGAGAYPQRRIGAAFAPEGPKGWSVDLTLEIEATTSTRRLEAESCRAAVDAAALVIALAIDPDAIARLPEEPAPPEPAPPAPVPPPAPSPPPQQPPAAPRSSPLEITGGLGVGLAAGLLPALTGAARLSAELGRNAWAVGLGGHYAWPVDVTVEADAGATLQAWGLDARACYVLRTGRPGLAFDFCATGHAGAMHGRGSGDAISAERGVAPWVAAGPTLGLRWLSRAHVGVFTRIDALAHILRPSFVLTEIGPVCCTGYVSVLWAAGLAFGSQPQSRNGTRSLATH